MKTFQEIISDNSFSVPKFINNHTNYFAHLGKDANNPETLDEHIQLVLEYFNRLVDANGIEPVVNSLIKQYLLLNNLEPDGELAELIKEMFIGVVLFHDFGKINPGFQSDRMKNPGFKNPNSVLGSKHSIISVWFFIAYYYNLARSRGLIDLNNEVSANMPFLFILFGLAYPVQRHHGQLIAIFDSSPFSQKEIEQIIQLYEVFIFDISTVTEDLSYIFQDDIFKDLVSDEGFLSAGNSASYVLIKLSFSLLTAADYYATNHFMSRIEWNDFGIFTPELKKKFVDNLYQIDYNKILLDKNHDILNEPVGKFSEFSNRNLNLLRSCLAFEVLNNIKDQSTKRLFYLEAPTGGGKTNLSFLAVGELLKSESNINKVFYVFPFTTLITQTFTTLTDKILMKEGEVAQIHSKSGNTSVKNSGATEGDDNYGVEKINFLTGYFYNYPILLTSHVKFFDLMLSHKKDSNYGLHRLANSVVIIDEIQSYSPEVWEKLIHVVREYSVLLNIRFIIMSATLPKIDKLLKIKDAPFVNLITDKEKYFKNPNFSGRVKYDFSLSQKSTFSLEDFAGDVLQIINSELKKKPDLRVLIEFVKKSAANEFYNLIRQDEGFKRFPNKFLLSGSILEPRRKELISGLKEPDKSPEVKHKAGLETKSERKIDLITGPVIVVATQVIEAGVDIDMDIGFKDKAMPDADDQFAGRVNRNARKQNCKVYLFKSGMANDVYRNDRRLDVVKKYLTADEYNQILIRKDFDQMYDLVLDRINREQNLGFADGLQSFEEKFNRADFLAVDRAFQLIADNSTRVFVPLDINVTLFENKEQQTAKSLNLINIDGSVSGKRLFTKYLNLLNVKDDDFVKKAAIIKNINALMANFTFSLFEFSDEFNKIKNFGDWRGDVFYLENFQSIYSFNDGIIN
jgi:CRISPR-associated endonuclease/helicase Cas3